MAFSDVVKNQNDTSMLVEDGTAVTPLAYTGRCEQGDITVGNLSAQNQETAAYESRGQLKSLRKTTRKYPTISFGELFTEFVEAATGTLPELIIGDGPYAARISTTEAKGDTMTFDITITIEGTDFGDAADHVLTAEDIEIDFEWAEGDPDAMSYTGTIYGAMSGDWSILSP